MSRRGAIKYRRRAKQLRDFSGNCNGKISPSDIDYFKEFANTLFVLGEIKSAGVRLVGGQRYAITNALRRWADSGAFALGFVAHHKQVDPDSDVDCSVCLVSEVWWGGSWTPCPSDTLIRDVENKALRIAGLERYIEVG